MLFRISSSCGASVRALFRFSRAASGVTELIFRQSQGIKQINIVRIFLQRFHKLFTVFIKIILIQNNQSLHPYKISDDISGAAAAAILRLKKTFQIKNTVVCARMRLQIGGDGFG